MIIPAQMSYRKVLLRSKRHAHSNKRNGWNNTHLLRTSRKVEIRVASCESFGAKPSISSNSFVWARRPCRESSSPDSRVLDRVMWSRSVLLSSPDSWLSRTFSSTRRRVPNNERAPSQTALNSSGAFDKMLYICWDLDNSNKEWWFLPTFQARWPNSSRPLEGLLLNEVDWELMICKKWEYTTRTGNVLWKLR